MEKLQQAADALTNYQRIYDSNVTKFLKRYEISKDDQDLARLSVKMAVVQAVMGLNMVVIGTEDRRQAAELLRIPSSRIAFPESIVVNLDDFMQRDLTKKRLETLRNLEILRQRESEIPRLLNPGVLIGLLGRFRDEVWPAFLIPQHQEKYTPEILNLINADTEWNIAYAHVQKFQDLRRSVVFERAIVPYIKAHEPINSSYSMQGLTKSSIAQIKAAVENMTRLVTKNEPNPKVKNKPIVKPELDLSRHPRAVHGEPGDSDLQWSVRSVWSPREDYDGLANADED